MSEHTVTDVSKRELRVVVTCSCGREFDHPGRDGAMGRHAYHAGVEAARAALRGEQP